MTENNESDDGVEEYGTYDDEVVDVTDEPNWNAEAEDDNEREDLDDLVNPRTTFADDE